jgi:Protein of unknown function (DUF2934)
MELSSRSARRTGSQPINQTQGVGVDSDTRRKKQQALMTEALERKIRLHAQRRYDERGEAEGSALQDWVQAETDVLENNALAPLYRRSRAESSGDEIEAAELQISTSDSTASEAGA